MTAALATPVLPDLDPSLGEKLGDDILIATAGAERTQRVQGGGKAHSRMPDLARSAQSRAWTTGGRLD